MSFQVDTAFVRQYHDTIYRLLQQYGSRVRPAVRNETQQGEQGFWEQIGAVEATEATNRHGDSPLANTPHARRRVTMRNWEVGDLIDNFDKVRLLIDPTSTYVQNFVDALGRRIDDTILDAMNNVAFTGKDGTTSVSFPAGQDIAVDFGSTGTNSNLTVNKVIQAKNLLLTANVNPDEQFYLYTSASGLMSMLKTVQVSSADYNTVKALVNGEIDTWMGFKWIIGQRGALATNTRTSYAWVKSGVLFATGMDIRTRVAERPDKRFSYYAYAAAAFGAVRMEEQKVVTIEHDETK